MELLIYLAKVSGCTAVFYLFYRILLRRNTFFGLNRIYLLATLLLSFSIPACTIRIEKLTVLPVPVSAVTDHREGLEGGVLISGYGNTAPAGAGSWAWPELATWIYYAGVLVMIVVLLRSLFRIYCLTRLPGRRTGRLTLIDHSSDLSNSSFFNYIFVNRQGLSATEWKTIIAHELVHVVHFHSADKLLLMLARAVLWCNPFIYLYQKALEEVHEYEADSFTARQFGQGEYATVLLDISSARAGDPVLNHFAKSQLKKRIHMLFKPESRNMKKLLYAFSMPLIPALVYAFSVEYVYAYTYETKQETPAGTTVPGRVLPSLENPAAGSSAGAWPDTGTKQIVRTGSDTNRAATLTIVSASRIAGKAAGKVEAYDAEIRWEGAKLYSPRVEIDYDKQVLLSDNARLVSKDATLEASKIIVDLKDNSWKAITHDKNEITINPVKTLVIDAGHGGADNASMAKDGTREKDLNLRAAMMLKEEAEKRGVTVIMTRIKDVYVPLRSRAGMATGDLVISLHHNTFPANTVPRATGVEVFVGRNSKYQEQSRAYGLAVLNALKKEIRGIKVDETIKQNALLVLDQAQSPGFLLELGNMSSDEDMAFIRDEDNLRKVCNLILDGLLNIR